MILSVAIPSERANKLLVPATSIVHAIDIMQIIRVQSMSNYSKLFFKNGKTLVVAKVLRWFEEQLPQEQFLRVHRTHLVNADYIQQYCSSNEGVKLELINGERIGVSKRKKAKFLRVIKSKSMIDNYEKALII